MVGPVGPIGPQDLHRIVQQRAADQAARVGGPVADKAKQLKGTDDEQQLQQLMQQHMDKLIDRAEHLSAGAKARGREKTQEEKDKEQLEVNLQARYTRRVDEGGTDVAEADGELALSAADTSLARTPEDRQLLADPVYAKLARETGLPPSEIKESAMAFVEENLEKNPTQMQQFKEVPDTMNLKLEMEGQTSTAATKLIKEGKLLAPSAPEPMIIEPETENQIFAPAAANANHAPTRDKENSPEQDISPAGPSSTPTADAEASEIILDNALQQIKQEIQEIESQEPKE